MPLLAEILDGRPNLPNARCRTHATLFDALADGKASGDIRDYANGLCRTCPHSVECPDTRAKP